MGQENNSAAPRSAEELIEEARLLEEKRAKAAKIQIERAEKNGLLGEKKEEDD